MSLNRPVSPMNKKRRIDRGNEDLFPLFYLPDELISLILSFLPIKDRLLACVNRRLNAIESKSKYYVERLFISEQPRYLPSGALRPIAFPLGWSNKDQHIIFFKGKSYQTDCLKRITHNVSIGELWVELEGSEQFHRDVYNIIKEFEQINWLNVRFMNRDVEKDIVSDSFILDLAKKCERLAVRTSGYISDNILPSTLHQIYKDMIENSKLTNFFMRINTSLCTQFLGLIGIRYQDRQFVSNRDLAVYKDEARFIHIFDGNLEIVYLDFDFVYEHGRFFKMQLHKTQEELDEAKNSSTITPVMPHSDSANSSVEVAETAPYSSPLPPYQQALEMPSISSSTETPVMATSPPSTANSSSAVAETPYASPPPSYQHATGIPLSEELGDEQTRQILCDYCNVEMVEETDYLCIIILVLFALIFLPFGLFFLCFLPLTIRLRCTRCNRDEFCAFRTPDRSSCLGC